MASVALILAIVALSIAVEDELRSLRLARRLDALERGRVDSAPGDA